jgi:hypothetical protein
VAIATPLLERAMTQQLHHLRRLDEPRFDWRGEAACRGTDPELFFPIGAGRNSLSQIAAAKRICARCPVIERCRESALANGYEGIWGGLDDDERRRMRARRQRTTRPSTNPEPLSPPGPELSADGHFVIVDGRRWRACDPGIPKQLRGELVAELMSARRAIGHGDIAARDRVQDAKTALGERGEPWWEPPTPEGRRARLASTMRALLRHRQPDATICPSDAARVVSGGSGREAMDQARSVADELRAQGILRITQRGEAVELETTVGPIRLGRGPKWTP